MMDNGDKLAIATLAAARCAASGKYEPADYVDAYATIERLFREYRETERAKGLSTWEQLARNP